MENLNMYGGQRILFKENGKWAAGNLKLDGAHLTEKGLFFDVETSTGTTATVGFEDLFLHARKLEDWELDPDYGTLVSKEDFIEDIKEERVVAAEGTAYMSDGEYQYYSVPRLNENWLNKQPFDYIVWIS